MGRRSIVVIIVAGVTAGGVLARGGKRPTGERSLPRRFAGLISWRLDRHGRYLRIRQLGIIAWVNDLQKSIFRMLDRMEAMRDYEKMLYEKCEILEERVDELAR